MSTESDGQKTIDQIFGELLASLKEVVAISDRKHNAWHRAHEVIAKAERHPANGAVNSPAAQRLRTAAGAFWSDTDTRTSDEKHSSLLAACVEYDNNEP